ncbi:MAG TPA: DUF4340 domain-containing protein, partial [Thermodesulfobacteriota bacterium]|nr:DUF4340 domain-containing protein [Thermodesulfobacteriota bacterium]
MSSYLKRFASTVIVFIIFIVMLAAVLFYNREKKQPEKTNEKVFPSLKTDEITSIDLKSAGLEFELRKEGGDWVVESGGKEFKADKGAVGDLIRDMGDMEVEKLVSRDPGDLSEYGFVDSLTEFSVHAKGTEYPVVIGDKIPVGSGIYVYDLGEGRVLIVKDRYLWGFLRKKPEDFRDRRILGLDKDGVSRITVRVGDFSTEFVNDGDRWYEVIDGKNHPADEKKVRELVGSFAELKAEGFEDDVHGNFEKYGLTE